MVDIVVVIYVIKSIIIIVVVALCTIGNSGEVRLVKKKIN